VKRDINLIRKILQRVEIYEDPNGLNEILQFDGYTSAQVFYHMKLLYDAGLITARVGDVWDPDTEFQFINLTWSGHEFLDAVRDDNLWEKAKEIVMKPGASFTFDILLAWLKAQVTVFLQKEDSLKIDKIFGMQEYKDARIAFDKIFIKHKLAQCDNNISKTADLMGVERSNLHRKIKILGIDT